MQYARRVSAMTKLSRPVCRPYGPACLARAGACTRSLLLLLGLAACTGSPASVASRPDFEVMTPAGLANVSIRQSPPGMTDAEFARFVLAGMERAAHDR